MSAVVGLEPHRHVERDEPHDLLGHAADLAEIGAGWVHVRVRVLLPVEQVLNVHSEVERPAAAETERAREVRVHEAQILAAHTVDAKRKRPFLEGRRLIGSYLGNVKTRSELPQLVDWYMDGRISLDGLISHRMSLDEIGRGFALLASGEARRVVITP